MEITRKAREQGVTFRKVRSSGKHKVWSLDGVMIPIPKHRELGRGLGEHIRKMAEPVLGERWWDD